MQPHAGLGSSRRSPALGEGRAAGRDRSTPCVAARGAVGRGTLCLRCGRSQHPLRVPSTPADPREHLAPVVFHLWADLPETCGTQSSTGCRDRPPAHPGNALQPGSSFASSTPWAQRRRGGQDGLRARSRRWRGRPPRTQRGWHTALHRAARGQRLRWSRRVSPCPTPGRRHKRCNSERFGLVFHLRGTCSEERHKQAAGPAVSCQPGAGGNGTVPEGHGEPPGRAGGGLASASRPSSSSTLEPGIASH